MQRHIYIYICMHTYMSDGGVCLVYVYSVCVWAGVYVCGVCACMCVLVHAWVHACVVCALLARS